MGRKIYIVPPGTADQYYAAARAAGAPEIVEGIPAALQPTLGGVALPHLYEEPSVSAAASPNPAVVSATVTVTATLSPAASSASVTFQVEGGQAYIEPVTNGQASHAFAFATAGTYRILVFAVECSTTTVEVVVQ